jgi:hypothetical protein
LLAGKTQTNICRRCLKRIGVRERIAITKAAIAKALLVKKACPA